MTPRKSPPGQSTRKDPIDKDETIHHIMAAGKELLLAAQGALRFCKDYVENTPDSKSKPNLLKFFQNAIKVADDLGGSIIKTSPVATAAKGMAKNIFDSMESEMSSRKKPGKKKRTPRKTGGSTKSTRGKK
ncbi:MAG: hypothetical protein HN337_08200 [Deltaproteobacteria bacterium]|jgi:hypothetical protein|nr:hypothetical protein [Deltaproteobacteria bacterium]